ncbi:MAG: hypothetical protein HOL01_13820 [Planctomycetaceae bacterium]|jgi:hypothetical protein|nr:hypothetical protein [Planctomycetaceae bacterium]MBT6487535.1 hypothetical protein [Planctomycetaceae bacterium]MBT6495621.1 hypothetical protein [Planctomycetaceae bacterium]
MFPAKRERGVGLAESAAGSDRCGRGTENRQGCRILPTLSSVSVWDAAQVCKLFNKTVFPACLDCVSQSQNSINSESVDAFVREPVSRTVSENSIIIDKLTLFVQFAHTKTGNLEFPSGWTLLEN